MEPTGANDMTGATPAQGTGPSACAACGAFNDGAWAFCTQCGVPRAGHAPALAGGGTPISPSSPLPDPPSLLATPPTIVVNLGEGGAPLEAPHTLPVSLGGVLPPVGPPLHVPGAPREEAQEAMFDPPTIPYRPPAPENVFVPVAPFPIAPLPASPPVDVASRLTDHQGNALAADADLFEAAPPEIGPLRSAATSLRRGHDSALRRFIRALPLALMLGGLAWLGVDAATRHFAPLRDPALEGLRWALALLVFVVVLWLGLSTRRVLSYVGVDGVARCDVRFRFWPPARPRMDVLAFARARDLTVDIAHRNGQLSFAYVWHGHDGAEVLRIVRRCRSTSDGSRPSCPGYVRLYDFCRSAERSWTLRLVASCKRVLAQPGGALSFPIYASNCNALRLQDGELVFSLAAGEARIAAHRLSSVTIVDGKVHFTTEEGDIALPCAQVGNLGALLLVLTHHLGVTVR